jgi:lysophospholipase L1-like esterase
VLVLGLTPVVEQAMPFAGMLWYSLAAVRHYEAVLEEVCMEADVPFLPLMDHLLADPGWRELLGSDGLHLNSEGHARLHTRIRHWQALLEWAQLEPIALVSASA